MESLEKKLMKLLIPLIIIGALVATVIVYSNTAVNNKTVNNKTVIEEDHYLKREHSKNNNRPTNCFPNK